MSIERERKIKSFAEMGKFAQEMAEHLRGDVLLLTGPLGAGKTTFVQALARSLGVKEKVASPSYTIAAEYVVQNHPTIKKLVHVDLYRLPEQGAANDVAVRAVLDEIDEPGRLTVIEWAERLGVTKPAKSGRAVKITFAHGSTPDERIVTVQTDGTKT